MTVLSRGARSRRGGRRPGWTLVTALLVLAIAASSALVFTERAELLKLAVILALWAAVVAAFVSVIYRRQSDIDQARARDLKLVYDLQLDREIAARREYELTVESQLRRELAAELQAQHADEVAALRAELAALRNNLEILFDTDLSHRPAIETDRTTVRAYSDWAHDTTDPGRSRDRFGAREDVGARDEDHIIDVPEEPPEQEEPHPQEPVGRRYSGLYTPPGSGGTHRMPSEERIWTPQPGAESRPEPQQEPVYRQEPPPEPVFRPQPQPEPEPSADEWQAAPAEGQWLPPGVPGSNWVSSSNGYTPPEAQPASPVSAEPRRGRHAGPAEAAPPTPPARRARHAVDAESMESDVPPSSDTTFPTPPPPAPESSQGPPPRHRSAETPPSESQHAQGQSVAELLARLNQGVPSEGGRRRRRED